MLKTRKISIYVITALLVSVSVFNYAHATAPSVTTNSADITSTHNVTLNCSYNSNGLYTTLWFQLGTNSSLNGARKILGNPSDCTAGVINLLSGTTYYFRAAASNADGTTYGSTNSFTMPGSSGGSASSTGSPSNGNGTVNNGNSSSGGYNNGSTSGPTAPLATTNGPTSVSSNSAVVNGSINPNNADTKFWFEFGTTQSLGSKTSIEPTGSGNAWQLVTGNISGLAPSTTYFYRVSAQNNFGTVQGGIMSFMTSSSGAGTSSGQSGGQVLGAVSGNGNTSAGKTSTGNSSKTSTAPSRPVVNTRPSFISLEYSLSNGGALVVVGDNLKPNPGEEFSYTIVYKNDSQYTFNEADLKVIIPIEADYLNADREPSKISANMVEFDLGNIAPGSQGTVTIVAKVKETTKSGTNLIFTSVLGYKDRFGVQLATTSYLTILVGQGVVGTSLSAFSLGSFIGSTGIFVLIVLFLIAMVSIFIYRLIKIRKNNNGKKDIDDIVNLDIPSTFEPIGPASGSVAFRR